MLSGGWNVGECDDKEDLVRILVIVLIPLLGACSVLNRMNFNAPSLDPNKLYLDPAELVSVSPRETYRYACASQPLLCLQRGIEFECRCP
jgi:hypothetical protein